MDPLAFQPLLRGYQSHLSASAQRSAATGSATPESSSAARQVHRSQQNSGARSRPVGNKLDTIEQWAHAMPRETRNAVAAGLETNAERDIARAVDAMRTLPASRQEMRNAAESVVRVRQAAAVLRKGEAGDSALRSAYIKRSALHGLMHEKRAAGKLQPDVAAAAGTQIAALTRNINGLELRA